MISIEPLEINWYGFRSYLSQNSIVCCLNGISSIQTSTPTPDALDISHSAPYMPPSVISCMQDAYFRAISPSGTTEISFKNAFASSMNVSENLSFNSSSFSFAMIPVPSIPRYFVTTIS